MDELLGFLKHAQAHVRQQAAAHVLQLTGSQKGLVALKPCRALVSSLARISGDVPSVAQPALSAMINLTQIQSFVSDFESCDVVNRCAENLSQEEYPLMQLDIILLANLTSVSKNITDELLKARGGQTLLTLATALNDDVDGQHESLDCVTNILTHVAQHEDGRKFLQNKDAGLIKGLLRQIYSKEAFRRRGMLRFLSNLMHSKDMIPYLTGPSLDYANKILTLITASESHVKEAGDEDSILTILSTLCALAATVHGRNELKRLKALQRIQGVDILQLPEGDARKALLELLKILEGSKKVIGTQSVGAAGPGSVIALDREKMAADGVSFVNGSLVKTEGGAKAGVSSSVPAQPSPSGDTAVDVEKVPALDQGSPGSDSEDDDDDDDGEADMGLD